MRPVFVSNTLSLSQVTAGCMRLEFSGCVGGELLRFVQECLALGVTTFDHAAVYGGYHRCEALFGEAVLKQYPQLRQKMQLVSKAGILVQAEAGNRVPCYDSSARELVRSVDASLLALGTDYLDLLLVHRPDPLCAPWETAQALDSLVQSGKVLNLGVSNFTPSQFSMLQSYLRTPLLVNQVELSACAPNGFFDGTVDYALEHRLALMAWSPLGGGGIFSQQEGPQSALRGKLEELAVRHGCGVDTLLFAFLFRHPAPLSAVAGTTKAERIRAAVKGTELNLPRDEWFELLQASRGYSVP